MRLRSIIIDDEETGIETLKLLIDKYVGDDIKVIAESIHAAKGLEMIENYMPDIVFLDISMPEMDGFEMLEKLNWKNFHLIFTTAHQEFGLKALKRNAVDYLLKPIDYKDLQFAVNKIKTQITTQKENLTCLDYKLLNNLNQHKLNKLAITTKHGVEYIDPLEIIYMESKSNYTLIYLKDSKELLTPKTLKEFEHQLCEANTHFIRIHHSYIINLHKILRYIKNADDVIMINNQKVPLAKSKKEIFYKWLEI